MGILIEADHVSRDYESGAGFMRAARRHRAVDDVCMHVDDDVVAVVGESGCGKSTLAHMLLGLLPPTSGQVRLDGRPIETMGRKEIARLVQPVFQDPYSSLNPSATIMSTLLLPLIIHKIGNQKERKENVAEIMDAVGLAQRHAESYPSQLSGGQRQRVAIARALIVRPRLIICDEPTSALDVSVQSQVLNLLIDLRERYRLNYILISHNLAVVEHMSTWVYVMHEGRVIEQGPTQEIFNNPQQSYTRTLLDSVLTPDLRLRIPTSSADESAIHS